MQHCMQSFRGRLQSLENEVKEKFPLELYGWGGLFTENLTFSELYLPCIKIPMDNQRFDCGIAAYRTHNLLSNYGLRGSIVGGIDQYGVFTHHYFLLVTGAGRAEKKFIDPTPLYPFYPHHTFEKVHSNPCPPGNIIHLVGQKPLSASRTNDGSLYLSWLGLMNNGPNGENALGVCYSITKVRAGEENKTYRLGYFIEQHKVLKYTLMEGISKEDLPPFENIIAAEKEIIWAFIKNVDSYWTNLGIFDSEISEKVYEGWKKGIQRVTSKM